MNFEQPPTTQPDIVQKEKNNPTIDDDTIEIEVDLGKSDTTIEKILNPEEISQEISDIFFNEPNPEKYLSRLSDLVEHTSKYENSLKTFVLELNKISNQQEFEMIKAHQTDENIIYKPINQKENDLDTLKEHTNENIFGGNDFFIKNIDTQTFIVADAFKHDNSTFKLLLHNLFKKISSIDNLKDIDPHIHKFEELITFFEEKSIIKDKAPFSSLIMSEKGPENTFRVSVFGDIDFFKRNNNTGKVVSFKPTSEKVKNKTKIETIKYPEDNKAGAIGINRYLHEEFEQKKFQKMEVTIDKQENLFIFSDGLNETELSKESVIHKILKKFIPENHKKPGSYRNRLAQKIRLASKTNFFEEFIKQNSTLDNKEFFNKLKEEIDNLSESKDDITGIII